MARLENEIYNKNKPRETNGYKLSKLIVDEMKDNLYLAEKLLFKSPNIKNMNIPCRKCKNDMVFNNVNKKKIDLDKDTKKISSDGKDKILETEVGFINVFLECDKCGCETNFPMLDTAKIKIVSGCKLIKK